MTDDAFEILSRQALDHFGELHQLDKAQEELAELLVALSKWRADRSADKAIAVIDEIADVTIVVDQLRELFGRLECALQTKHKQERLAKRMTIS
jgi:hypothetical protein